ncbi:MAG: peptidase M16 [Gammaproteobacteria bacterium]|nr:peptidase M16 [Gammaproteobacteria bacterium]
MQTEQNAKSLLSHPPKVHPAFEWKHSKPIESLNIVVEAYIHKKTEALHYHINADNPENVFLVALRTMPDDSTGVAHILEHTALCGSKHYPVRDPFFMMIRRSLNTFMNAFTSSDWTAYPFASQNTKDYFNLLDVYLDAVFFARLHELDFAQEGHRLEFEDPKNPDSNLVYKGVVFNEMIGAMASPVSTVWQTLTKHLFPTTTYHNNSGGDPKHIPDLSYEQFLAFYKTHYHPSNAIFMTFGNIPANVLQDKFEQRALNQFERLANRLTVKDEKRYNTPLKIEDHYALDEENNSGNKGGKNSENKTHIVLGWLLGISTDLKEAMNVHLLSGVLMDNSASPLLHALETTELGKSPSPLCGVEDSNREMTFMCGIEGSKPKHADKFEALVLNVLNDVANNGVPQQQVEAVLHQIELEQREVGGGHYPYGLQLILDALPSAVHYGDPVAALDLDPVLAQLREDIKNPQFIKDLVRDYLLKNPHYVRLTMVPDATLSLQRQKEEAAKLAKIKAQLSNQEKNKIIDLAHKLLERQQQKDDESILPKVGLEDVPDSMHIAEGRSQTINTLPVSIFEQGTNGLVYQQIVYQLPHLSDDLIQYLPYYSTNVTELGSGNRTYLESQVLQSSITGGINAFTAIRGNVENEQDVAGYFFLSGKSLARNHNAFSRLMREIVDTTRFDEYDRIHELVSQQRAQREQSVTGQGHSLAMMAASSGMSPAAALKHRLSGLQGIQHAKRLDDSLKESTNVKDLAEKLAEIHSALTTIEPQLLLTGEPHEIPRFIKEIEAVWGDVVALPPNVEPFSLPEIHQRVQQIWVANAPINFCAKAYPTVPIEHSDSAPLAVLAGFLRNGFLHTAIREQGGAYGGGAGYCSDTASFRFYSYRDPRLVETLADFDKSIDWLLTEKHGSRQLEEAILGVISSIDKPSSPAGEAKDAFQNQLFGRTPNKRQQYRKQIINVTLADLKRVADTYFSTDNASTAIISNAATIEQLGDLGMEVIHL